MQDRTQNRKRKENSMSELKIGNVTLENNLILAPMAGVTDLPFRLLCRRQDVYKRQERIFPEQYFRRYLPEWTVHSGKKRKTCTGIKQWQDLFQLLSGSGRSACRCRQYRRSKIFPCRNKRIRTCDRKPDFLLKENRSRFESGQPYRAARFFRIIIVKQDKI